MQSCWAKGQLSGELLNGSSSSCDMVWIVPDRPPFDKQGHQIACFT
jgi:hypothetical protein